MGVFVMGRILATRSWRESDRIRLSMAISFVKGEG